MLLGLQAEYYVGTSFECLFTQSLEVESSQSRLKTQGTLHKIGRPERRFTGYMLICADPGQEYRYFAFVR